MQLFISYRRNDSPDIAGRIHDRLVEQFSAENVYYDVDSIEFGIDFRDQIDSMVRACDVVLVVIGPDWFKTEAGKRQIDDPGDFVRIEVESALQREIRVVPTLVHGAGVPSPNDLPESIRALAYRHGLQVRRDPDFHSDMTRLITSLTTPSRSRPPSEGTRSSPHAPPRPPRVTNRHWTRRYRKAALAAGAAILVVTSLVLWRTVFNTGSVTAPGDASAVTSVVMPPASATEPVGAGTGSVTPAAAPGLPGAADSSAPGSATFRVVRTLGTADNPADLEVDGADLLVSFGSGLLQRIDSTDGNVKSQINFNVAGGNDLLANSNELAVTLVAGGSVGFAERALISSDSGPTIELGGAAVNGATVPDGFWFACDDTHQSGFLQHVSGRQKVGDPIPLKFVPNAVLADGNDLYVTSYEQGFVAKVDIQTGVVQQSPESEDHPVDLALAGGNLWVTLSGSDQVAVLDRDSLTPIKGPYSVGDRPWKMSVGLGSVWITNSAEKGSVSRLDPETGQRQQDDIPVGITPDELAVGDGLIYVTNRGSNTISVLGT